MSIDLNSEKQTQFFHWTLLGIFLYCFVYMITNFSIGKKRYAVFNPEFMSQFNQENQEVFGKDAPKGGHPDDGNGYYSQKLSYLDWYEFQNWQRAHMNYLEQIAIVVTMVFITAIHQPMWAMVSIYVMVIGRILYGLGYCRGGPKGRVLGAIIADIGLLSVLIGGFYSVFSWDKDQARYLPISVEKFTSL